MSEAMSGLLPWKGTPQSWVARINAVIAAAGPVVATLMRAAFDGITAFPDRPAAGVVDTA